MSRLCIRSLILEGERITAHDWKVIMIDNKLLWVPVQISVAQNKAEGMMLQQIKNYAVRILMLTLLLIMLSLLISYIMKESGLTLQDTLFWVGAVPIALFSIGIFGNFSSRGDPEYQLSKTVLKQSPNQRSSHETDDVSKRTSSHLTWVIAGLLVWLVSYFIWSLKSRVNATFFLLLTVILQFHPLLSRVSFNQAAWCHAVAPPHYFILIKNLPK